MKKLTIMMLIGILTVTMTTGCGCTKKEKENEEPETKANTNEDVIKDQKVEVFEFTNTSLVYENGMSTLGTTVTNTSEEAVTLTEFNIHVKDANGNEIVELKGFVGEELKAHESRLITSYCTADLTTASSITYEVIR